MPTTPPLNTARFKLAHERPYLASVLWALVPVEKPGLGTFAVDKYYRLYYDPACFDKWTMPELVAVLYHEVNHLLRDHSTRGEGKDQKGFNIAADMEINDDIKAEDGLDLPAGCVYPESIKEPDGKMAEYYYSKLPKKKVMVPLGPAAGDCGSAAHGHDQDYEDGAPNGKNSAGLKPGEAQLNRQQVAKDIEAASKSRGDIPGHLKRWAEVELKPKVDWRRALGAAVRQTMAQKAGANDYTLNKISRRQSGDIIMPSTFTPIPNVAVFIDTSGSMNKEDLAQCTAEVGSILKSLGASDGVTAVALDAEIQVAKRVFSEKQVKLEGGGGTDMRLGFQHAKTLRPQPDVLIFLTDGETPWPENPPRYKVIIALINKHRTPPTPSWAKTVVITHDDET